MIASTILFAALLAATAPRDGNLAHSGPLNVSCRDCHTRLPFVNSTPPLRSEAGDICISCHQRYHGADAMRSHPLLFAPSLRVPADMILDHQGRIGCITCHSYHGTYRDEEGKKLYYLRRTPGKIFCYSCHKSLPGAPGKP